MKITILRSIESNFKIGFIDKEYSVKMDTGFAQRFISHLRDEPGFCKSCENECINCREKFNLDFSSSIIEIVDFPDVLPIILEEPEEYLRNKNPKPTDIVISISVNEEILESYIKKFHSFKGLIVPIEKSSTITPYGKNKIEELCKNYKIEVDFPKPFCTFNPSEGILLEFKKFFKIGLPEVVFEVKQGRIKDARVITSAPCGATYYVAKNVIGCKVNAKIINIIDTLLSRYPCTADHSLDKELGDSIMHQAVKAQRVIIKTIKQACL